MKREPTLADLFINTPPANKHQLIDVDVVQKITRRVQVAEKFVLDERAARRVGKLIRETPEFISENAQFCRPPFDVTWVEFPHDPLFSEMTGQSGLMPGSAVRMGYLYDNGRAYNISGPYPRGMGEDGRYPNFPGALVSPFAYDLHTEWPLEEQKLAYGKWSAKTGGPIVDDITQEKFIDIFLWGSQYDSLTQEQLLTLRHNNRPLVLPLRKGIQRQIEDSWAVASEFLGDLKKVIMMALVLSRPGVMRRVAEQAHGRGTVLRKTVRYWAHTTVTIDLDSAAIVREPAYRGPAETKRRHKVRGTWCHSKEARIGTCIHVWQPDEKNYPDDDPKDPDHYGCEACGGKRWWREAHVRGDATKGWVTKEEYSVTARKG